jgi:hypothetical protein
MILKNFSLIQNRTPLKPWRGRLGLAVLCATSLITLAARASTQSPGEITTNNEASSNPALYKDLVGRDNERRPSDQDQELIRLALKYVVYQDATGNPVISEKTARKVTEGINQLYKSCKIEFVPEKYEPVQPQKIGFDFNTQSMNELDPIRSHFAEANRLVVVNTGDWNHNSMGTANAWTAMPGSMPAGAIIEANAASFAGIVAHELGHYLSLDHLDENINVMNPVIYESSNRFEPWQCDEMRQSAFKHWRPMVR